MVELSNTPYQKNIVNKKIEPLSDFLNGVSVRKGTNKPFDPYVRGEENQKISFTNSLVNIQESRGDKVSSLDNSNNETVDGLYLSPNQRYFMGSSSEPPMVIVTKVTDDKVHYYLFPYKKEQVLKKEIAADLFKTGCKNWLRDPRSRKDPELRESIKAVINGSPGDKVSLDDYQFSSVQVKYVGTSEGDLEPWKELESEFDVKVDSVLTNKQTYNLRLNNRELDHFSQNIRKSKNKHFKIIKIIREEREYMLESVQAPKLKIDERKIRPEERNTWGELMNQNRTMNYGAEGFLAGEPVVWNKKGWFIVDFVPSGEEMTAVLLKTDYTEVSSFVPLKDIKKHAPMEMGSKDDEVPDAVDKDTDQSFDKKKETKGSKKPKDYSGKNVEGVAVDETPKEKEVTLPQSSEDGITQDQKALKEETNLPVGKVKKLVTCIQNDPVLYSKDGRFQTIVENLLRKKKEGIYNSDLAAKAFETLADMGARKCSQNPDLEYPRSIRQRTGEAFRDQFESEIKMGNIKQESRDEMIQNKINNLIEETDQQVNEAVEKEAVPFTEKEIEEFKNFENVDDSKENVITFSWNSGGKNYKLEITKKPRPSTNDLVYSAVCTFNNNQLDRERTIDSDPFKTEDDVTILNDFISSLKLNESEEENIEEDKTKCPDLTGEADKKSLDVKDVHPEQLMMGIKVELEHTKDPKVAKQIALDHLAELPDYYTRLEKMEKEGGVVNEEGSAEKYKKEVQKKKETKSKKKEPSHTTTKIVNSLPIRDGKKIRTEVVGDSRIVYKTFEEKRKKSLKDKQDRQKEKGE